MRTTLIIRVQLALVALALVSACNPLAFEDDLRAQAPTITLRPPNDFGDNFGEALGTVTGSINGLNRTRLAVSGGSDSPVIVFPLFDEAILLAGRPNRLTACEVGDACDIGHAASVPMFTNSVAGHC